MIQHINIKNISPHPDNPRKDLGDLMELTNSIRENGILQNLTVVPWFSSITGEPADDGKMDGEYRVVIGHRRLAAAKKAGLVEVPCIVKEMDPKAQVATMLLENMQRSDLTPYEQAQGFQMMLDLGETVANISQSTGLSETTVRHRVKLCELDQGVLKEKAKNVSLFDLVKLEKIKDLELKNEVLKEIGTNNFDWKYRDALSKEQTREKKERLLSLLSEAGKEISGSEGKKYIGNLLFYGSGLAKLEESLAEYKRKADPLYYWVSECQIDLYKDIDIEDTKVDEEAKLREVARRAREERTDRLRQIHEQAETVRETFMKGVSSSKLKEQAAQLLEFAVIGVVAGNNFDYDNLFALMDIDDEEQRYLDPEGGFDEEIAIRILAKEHPSKMALYCLYLLLKPSLWNACFDWQGSYRKSDKMEEMYRFLGVLGYTISDEEKQMVDGSHPLYIEEDR